MKFTVVIATSQSRTDWLINRSLLSVYRQKKVLKSEWRVCVVDDNEDEKEFIKIKESISRLRKKLQLLENEFSTIILRNNRTRFMSGTGAWNTGIKEAYRNYPKGFISILDDDDEYLPHHLADCVASVKKNVVAVFQRLIWINEDESILKMQLKKEGLTTENFFVGNPGVQGSNMFFKTQSLVDIGGFDESMPNTTDRDLMIRFLANNDLNNIVVIETVGVNHYNHKREKVNNNLRRKQEGLDLFYQKYKKDFTQEAYEKSLIRAKKYFHYNSDFGKEQIVICMPVKNAEKTLFRAIDSFLRQTNTKRELILLIGNDNSSDKSSVILEEIASQNPSIVVVNVNFGKPHLNRNFLNDYVRTNFPSCVLIGRLDADDLIYNKSTLSKIEQVFDDNQFDILICGNKQAKEGLILDWENKPSKKLLTEKFLLKQLKEMSQNKSKAELPSCNIFIRPTVKVTYPKMVSAEDHWFTVLLLLQKEKLNIRIEEELIYCIYSLDGVATDTNRKTDDYLKSRTELYKYYKTKINE